MLEFTKHNFNFNTISDFCIFITKKQDFDLEIAKVKLIIDIKTTNNITYTSIRGSIYFEEDCFDIINNKSEPFDLIIYKGNEKFIIISGIEIFKLETYILSNTPYMFFAYGVSSYTEEAKIVLSNERKEKKMNPVIQKDIFEIEQWYDPECEDQLVKLKKITPDGKKIGIIINVRDSSLYEISEGMYYPKVLLPKK